MSTEPEPPLSPRPCERPNALRSDPGGPSAPAGAAPGEDVDWGWLEAALRKGFAPGELEPPSGGLLDRLERLFTAGQGPRAPR
jgi:hypothetical protein